MENTFFKEDTPYEHSYYTLEEIEHLKQIDRERCKTDSKIGMSIIKLLADSVCEKEMKLKFKRPIYNELQSCAKALGIAI